MYLIKVNYRLFLLDLYGVQYEDYEVNTLLPVPHNFFLVRIKKIKKMIISIQVDVSIYLILSWFDDRVQWANTSSRQMISTFHQSHLMPTSKMIRLIYSTSQSTP